MNQLRRVQDGAGDRDEAAMAEVRARATAEVLEAQRVAAAAVRARASAEQALARERDARGRERAEWAEVRAGLIERQARDAAAIDDLGGALDGAKGALESELRQHHADVQALEARLASQSLEHAQQRAAVTDELDRCRSELTTVTAKLELTDARLAAVLAESERATTARRELELRAARAEAERDQWAVRGRHADEQLLQARADLGAERSRHEATARQLRQQLAVLSRPRPGGRGGRGATTSTRRAAFSAIPGTGRAR